MDVLVELGDRVLVDVEQVAQRDEADRIGLGEFETGRAGPDRSVPTARPRRAGSRSLAMTPWIWALALVRCRISE